MRRCALFKAAVLIANNKKAERERQKERKHTGKSVSAIKFTSPGAGRTGLIIIIITGALLSAAGVCLLFATFIADVHILSIIGALKRRALLTPSACTRHYVRRGLIVSDALGGAASGRIVYFPPGTP